MMLSRTITNPSVHVHDALRRMATIEIGEFVDHDTHGHDSSSDPDHDTDRPRDEEKQVGVPRDASDGKRESAQGVEVGKDGGRQNDLQDQTNLLPVKQVIFVFLGLTCALFCSLLDQTM